MKKSIILVLALLVVTLMAAPSNFSILKLPAGSVPAVDGSIAEWNDSYFIDSLRNTNNCFATDDGTFIRSDYQMSVYAAWDDLTVYFAISILADNVNTICGSSAYSPGCDNAKINPGGQAAAFYIYANNNVSRNPSNPWQLDADLFAKANATASPAGLPAYEFSVSRQVLDQFDLRTFQLSVGSEDEDGGAGSTANSTYAAPGVEYTGSKSAWTNQWDNPLYYPTWALSETEGSAMSGAVESKSARLSAEQLSASPNPFMPSTVISYNVRNNGTLKIYDVNGKVVQSVVTKAGANKVQWKGTDMNGKSLSSGIYIARLVSGNTVLNRQLFLTR